MAQTAMQIVKELLAKGADVNWVEEKTGVTPLMVASSEGFGETAAVLAAHEALVRTSTYTLRLLSTPSCTICRPSHAPWSQRRRRMGAPRPDAPWVERTVEFTPHTAVALSGGAV